MQIFVLDYWTIWRVRVTNNPLGEYFIVRRFWQHFLVKFSFGYIPHYSCVRKNEYLTRNKAKYLSDNIIEISSIVFESCLVKYDIFDTFFLKLKE